MATVDEVAQIAAAIQEEVALQLGPPPEGVVSRSQHILPRALTTRTRAYIERVANQINGTYESGYSDACAVMMRRLVETLIIETFEAKGLADTIKNAAGDFMFLNDLIAKALDESSWNLSRNCKRALPRLKDMGDKSAHSRRYNAYPIEIEKLAPHVRVVAQELINIAGLQTPHK